MKQLTLIVLTTGYINVHNVGPKPIIWATWANDSLTKVKRARKALNKL